MNQKSSSILIPVILSGGNGSRLWPFSKEGHPKPFINLFDGETLLEKTYRRISSLKCIPKFNGKPLVLTVTNTEYYFISKDELEKTNVGSFFLIEPESRNTAPAIAIAALWVRKEFGPNASMLVLPADHIIQDQNEFELKVNHALELNNCDPSYLVTFGIQPQSPDTGFSYIESWKLLAKGFKVNRLYEKPDLKKAEDFFRSQNFFWNSGIFCFKVSQLLEEMKTHSPELLEQIENSWQACINKKSNDKLKIEIPLLPFKDCPNISIDYALMEQSKNVAMIPANFNWNDVGSWLSFSALSKPDIKGKNTKNNNHVKQLNV